MQQASASARPFIASESENGISGQLRIERQALNAAFFPPESPTSEHFQASARPSKRPLPRFRRAAAKTEWLDVGWVRPCGNSKKNIFTQNNTFFNLFLSSPKKHLTLLIAVI